MTIYLSNDDVRTLLPMDECIALMEQVFRDEADGKAVNLPRQHLPLPQSACTAPCRASPTASASTA